MKKYLKKLIRYLIVVSIIMFGIILILKYQKDKDYKTAPIPSIEDVFIDEENNLKITFKYNKDKLNNQIYCMFNITGETPKIDDENWLETTNNECSIQLDDNIYYGYLKNYDGKIIKVDETKDLGKVIDLKINKEKVYLAINGTYTLTTELISIGNVNKTIKWSSSNEEIATINSDGQITGISNGITTITAKIEDYSKTLEIIVTDLITIKPKNEYDFKKANLSCNKYTKEENDMLDEILKDRINDAGYKTRAGALEAARFLTLEFPYRINYFNENGRLTGNKVDGEGRYYHIGLYLDESRYENISKSSQGPKTWGCSMYSKPPKKNKNNGLDCSGFVTWALLNGGFDVGDIGAGITAAKDLTQDVGTRKSNKKSLITDGTIKSGDLVHNTEAGGHIGMIVGIDDKYVYVAQALWYDEVGVIITKDTYNDFVKRFPDVVLMDKYYKEDGNYTKMW